MPPVSSAADGLEGRELRPSADLRSGITTALSGLLSGSSEPPGEIVAVWVVDDAPDRLSVDVRYADLGGYRLRGLVLDSKMRPMRAVSVGSARLEQPHGDAGLTFDLLGRPGSDPESGYLMIEVLEEGRSLAVDRRWFDLTKRWGDGAEPGTGGGSALDGAGAEGSAWPEPPRRVEITPVPVGRAASLAVGSSPEPRPRAPTRVEAAEATAEATPEADGGRGASTGASRRPASRPSVRDRRSDGSSSSRPSVRDRRSEGESSASRPAARDRRSGSDSPSRPPVRDRRTRTAGTGDGSVPTHSRDARTSGTAILSYGVEASDRRQGARGPDAVEVDLLADWLPDPAVDLEESDVVPFSRVYQDQSSDSGYYYYRPASYRLAWDDADGLALHMLYQAGLGGAAGDVLIRMTLDAGLDRREIEVARALLEARKARRSISSFRALRRIPIDSAPDVRLAEDLEQLFDIPADKVRASGVSDALGRLDVALVTDSVTKENLQLALIEGGGLGGRVVLAPSGGAVPPQLVPFAVDPTDEKTYPRLYWWPGDEWTNPYPYPVRPRWLHVLRLVQNRPVVYSWDLGGERVSPGSSLWVDPAPVPAEIREGALRTWIDYDLDDACEPCHRTVMAALTGGVREVTATEIVFRALSPLSDSGATEIALEVRSRYFHPSSRTLRSQPVTVIAEDGRSYEIGPIYPAAAEADGEVLFEYRLRLVMPDGRVLGGDRWVPGTGLYQPLGTVQIEAATGTALAGAR